MYNRRESVYAERRIERQGLAPERRGAHSRLSICSERPAQRTKRSTRPPLIACRSQSRIRRSNNGSFRPGHRSARSFPGQRGAQSPAVRWFLCPLAAATADALPRSEAVASSRASASIPRSFFLILSWAPPSGSPADLPLVFTYKSDSSNSTEFGSNWSSPYHRFAEPNTRITPTPVSVNTPSYSYSYANSGTSYSPSAPGQNTLVGNATTGWTETQPDGTSFKYDSTGVLRSIGNRAGVRWTLTWDAAFDLVQAIQGPLGRRTSFVYNASNFVRRIVDPGGRITTLTVNASSDLTQIVSPQLCVTSLDL